MLTTHGDGYHFGVIKRQKRGLKKIKTLAIRCLLIVFEKDVNSLKYWYFA